MAIYIASVPASEASAEDEGMLWSTGARRDIA